MMHAQPLSHGEKRWVLAISQKHLRTLHPARRLGSRPRKGHQPRDLLIRHRHLKRLSPCRHDVSPRSALLKRGIRQHTSGSMVRASSMPVSWNRSSSYEMTGTTRSNPPGGMFDKNSFHCVGMNASLDGKDTGSTV